MNCASVLTYIASALMFSGLAAAMAGAAMRNVLFDIGMWGLIAAIAVYAAMVVRVVVERVGAAYRLRRRGA